MKHPTPLEYARWLVSLPPQNTLASPSLTYILGGADRFNITEKRAGRLYTQATRFLTQRHRLSKHKMVCYQWDGQSSMSTAIEEIETFWEFKE